jgi:hypothetical protein
MSAGKLNILIEQNATFNKVLTIYSTGTTPLNLTGKTLRGQVRYNLQDAEPAATFTFTAANQNTDPGVCTMLIPASVTSTLKQSKGYYDVELVDGVTVTRLLEGQVFISLGATQS